VVSLKLNQSTLFARQPIYKSDLSLYGYELLYRDGDVVTARITNSETATCNAVLDYCTGMYPSLSQSQQKIFINISTNMLQSDYFAPFHHEHIVLELLEDTSIDAKTIEKIKRLSGEGFSIAIDDFTFESKWDVILPYVDIIKVDVLNFKSFEDLQSKMLRYLRENQTRLKESIEFLAEKVENSEMFLTYPPWVPAVLNRKLYQKEHFPD